MRRRSTSGQFEAALFGFEFAKLHVQFRAAQAMLILVLDSKGITKRAHLLMAEPAELGPAVREVVFASEFPPRVVNGEAVESNAVLFYRSRRSEKAGPQK